MSSHFKKLEQGPIFGEGDRPLRYPQVSDIPIYQFRFSISTPFFFFFSTGILAAILALCCEKAFVPSAGPLHEGSL